MLFRLWTLNRVLRRLGLTVTIDHPTAPDLPTLISVKRDAEGELRYMRCVQASKSAWDVAAAVEYSA